MKPIETGLTPTSGAFCALPRVQPRDCPACHSGVIFDPRALKCEPCLKRAEDEAKAKKTINDLGNANRRAGR